MVFYTTWQHVFLASTFAPLLLQVLACGDALRWCKGNDLAWFTNARRKSNANALGVGGNTLLPHPCATCKRIAAPSPRNASAGVL